MPLGEVSLTAWKTMIASKPTLIALRSVMIGMPPLRREAGERILSLKPCSYDLSLVAREVPELHESVADMLLKIVPSPRDLRWIVSDVPTRRHEAARRLIDYHGTAENLVFVATNVDELQEEAGELALTRAPAKALVELTALLGPIGDRAWGQLLHHLCESLETIVPDKSTPERMQRVCAAAQDRPLPDHTLSSLLYRLRRIKGLRDEKMALGKRLLAQNPNDDMLAELMENVPALRTEAALQLLERYPHPLWATKVTQRIEELQEVAAAAERRWEHMQELLKTLEADPAWKKLPSYPSL
jgi:hypothetical protein